MARPATLDRDEFGVPRNEHAPEARVWSGLFGKGKEGRPPSGYLGPSFRVTYEISVYWPRIERFSVYEDLYPFAAAGPVAYTPRQHYTMSRHHTVPPGWHPYPRVIVERFQAFGLPLEPPLPLRLDPTVPIALAVAALLVSLVQIVTAGRTLGRGQPKRRPRVAARQV